MSGLIYIKIAGEKQGNISAGCGTYESIGNRWQRRHEDEIFSIYLSNTLVNTGKGINLQGLSFGKLIDKSTPLLCNAINNNERLFIEIDLRRINRSGGWERYYYIQLRNAFISGINTSVTNNDLDTEIITVSYEYIQCRHLIANTEFDYLTFQTAYHDLFVPRPAKPAVTRTFKPEPPRHHELPRSTPNLVCKKKVARTPGVQKNRRKTSARWRYLLSLLSTTVADMRVKPRSHRWF